MRGYHLLGRTGLRVSPLCLGTMTFGNERWGTDEATARELFSRYLDASGNFVDTADAYADGRSEELTGQFIRETKSRDRVVLATKFTFNAEPGNPNSGGNGRKNVMRAVDASLKRLGTDFIDLYWLHVWDKVTPIEEVMRTFEDLVRAGKIRHAGLSDVPAWYAARAQTLAEARGSEPVAALQLEYSLVEREIEREHVPAAIELGMSICPWGPLASGLLTGKYRREGEGAAGEGRLDVLKETENPVFRKFTPRNWRILEELTGAAKEIGRSPAEVAIAWVAKRPGVTSTLIGANSVEQLEANLDALSVDLPGELSARLEEASRPEPRSPWSFFLEVMQDRIRGGVPVKREPSWYRAE